MGFWHEKRSDRYIEDTDRFPGWKGELPVPIQDFRNKTDAGEAPAALTIGVGANGKVAIPPQSWFIELQRTLSWPGPKHDLTQQQHGCGTSLLHKHAVSRQGSAVSAVGVIHK